MEKLIYQRFEQWLANILIDFLFPSGDIANFSVEFLVANEDRINWEIMNYKISMSVEFIERFRPHINRTKYITEQPVYKHFDIISVGDGNGYTRQELDMLSSRGDLPYWCFARESWINWILFTAAMIRANRIDNKFIEEFRTRLDWKVLINSPKIKDLDYELVPCFYRGHLLMQNIVSIDYLRKHKNNISWQLISQYHTITDEIIDEFYNVLNWSVLTRRRVLDINWIERYQEKIDWDEISRYHPIKHNFIDKFGDKINWKIASAYQIIDIQIAQRYQDKIDWNAIYNNKQCSFEVLYEFVDKITLPSSPNPSNTGLLMFDSNPVESNDKRNDLTESEKQLLRQVKQIRSSKRRREDSAIRSVRGRRGRL